MPLLNITKSEIRSHRSRDKTANHYYREKLKTQKSNKVTPLHNTEFVDLYD